MNIEPFEHDVYGPGRNREWFASTGIGPSGQGVTLNFFADSKEDVKPIAQGLGIAFGVTCHVEAEHIAPASEYDHLK